MNQAKKTSTDKVFAVLQPNVFYRPRDVAEETGFALSTCYSALSSLAEGGGVELASLERGRRVYITRQGGLFK